MPILSTKSVAIENTTLGYNRLALRGSLNVVMIDGKPVAGSLSLHATRYRKPKAGDLEVCGLIGAGEIGETIDAGKKDDDLLADLAGHVGEVLGYTGDGIVTMQFAWRPESGDIIGIAIASIVPIVDDKAATEYLAKSEWRMPGPDEELKWLDRAAELNRATGDTSALAKEDAKFGVGFSSVLAAIHAWASNRGW